MLNDAPLEHCFAVPGFSQFNFQRCYQFGAAAICRFNNLISGSQPHNGSRPPRGDLSSISTNWFGRGYSSVINLAPSAESPKKLLDFFENLLRYKQHRDLL
jgi:hypothetical protein